MTNRPAVPRTYLRPASTYAVLDPSKSIRAVRMDRLEQAAAERQSRDRRTDREVAKALALAMEAAVLMNWSRRRGGAGSPPTAGRGSRSAPPG